jgi:hypothetical protein
MGLMVRESFVNETKGYRFSESDWYEAFTDSRKRLFRDCQKEYGRCTSAIYVDVADGPPKQIGWYFEKRMEYEDSRPSYDSYTGKMRKPDTYIRGVWVHVQDTVRIACSNCGHEWDGMAFQPCPECGAMVDCRELTEGENTAS